MPALRFPEFTDAWEQRKCDVLKELKQGLLQQMFVSE